MKIEIEKSMRIDITRKEYEEIMDVYNLLERLLVCFPNEGIIISKTTGEAIDRDELLRMRGILAALTYRSDEHEWTF